MPTQVTSYVCHHCKDLILSTARHVVVADFSAAHMASEDDNTWKKGNQAHLVFKDVAFCNESCLSDFILENLKFKN